MIDLGYLFIFTIGFCAGMIFSLLISESVHKTIEKRKEEENPKDADGYTYEDKHSYWRIVRYRNGHFDCIWKSCLYDKRVADKKCAKLNDPNNSESHYGTYIVEKD